MCLKENKSPEDRKELLKDVTRDGMTVYKIAGVRDGRYYPLCMNKDETYGEGLVDADTSQRISYFYCNGYYQSGFHFFMNKDVAKKLMRTIRRYYKKKKLPANFFQGKYKIIECIVKKSWITKIGPDQMTNTETDSDTELVVVAKKAIFPE